MSNRRNFFGGLAVLAGAMVGVPGALEQAANKPGPQPKVNNGLIFISGQGANDNGAVSGSDIEAHTRKTLDNVKRAVEAGGGTMESILQLTVYLATLEDYEGMNKVYRTYFPHGGPARSTVAVAGVPGRSLLEINCIAAVVR